MGKIKVSELFTSFQGEGRYVGVQSVFLRTFGCNFRCPAFGLDHNYDIKVNPEVAEIIKKIPQYKAEGKTLKDLPLVKSGCDSYAAIYPEFKDFSPMLTVDAVVNEIKKLGEKKFGVNKHLILTGGEPMLPGWQKAYPELIEKLKSDFVEEDEPFYITIESNGTQPMLDTFKQFLQESRDKINLRHHFSLSLKLKASGHTWQEAFQPLTLNQYIESNPDHLDFKFVCDREEHLQQVRDLFDGDLKPYCHFPVYIMPEGGTNEKYMQNKKTVAELALKYGFRFTPRLQCELYKNAWGT